jgi:hypothetical protein
MDNGSRSNLKLVFFVAACVAFCAGLGIGLLSIHDASTHPTNEYTKVGAAFTSMIDYVMAFLVTVIACFQPPKRILVLAPMVLVLVLLPRRLEPAQARTDQAEAERLTRQLTPKFSAETLTSLAFHTDLDQLAPLGDGHDNVATWFDDFSAHGGARLTEWTAARARIKPVTVPGFTMSVLAPDDPLVREAEPWMNHAKCRFYSDEIAVQEQARKKPNLYMALTLGLSWIARGSRNRNLDDLQRAMRLGRLLRQDDVTIDQDETALDLINTAAMAMNGLAVSNGDSKRSGQIGPVLTESSTIRLETADRLMLLNADQVPRLLGFAKTAADRRFRLAAMRRLDSISAGANTDPEPEAFDALVQLEQDPDPLVAATARWYVSAQAKRTRQASIIAVR